MEPNKPKELFEQGKKWWESKTIWGAIVVIVPQLLKLAGLDADIIVTENVNDTVETFNFVWNDVASLVGAALAWWGRVKARTIIK